MSAVSSCGAFKTISRATLHRMALRHPKQVVCGTVQGYQGNSTVAGNAGDFGWPASDVAQPCRGLADWQKLADVGDRTPHIDKLSSPSPYKTGSSDSLCETRGSPGSEAEEPDASQDAQFVASAALADFAPRPPNPAEKVSKEPDCKPCPQAASSQSTDVLQHLNTKDQSCEAGLSLIDAEQRKQHRRTANRESARKTREKRLHACSRLEAEVCFDFVSCFAHSLQRYKAEIS